MNLNKLIGETNYLPHEKEIFNFMRKNNIKFFYKKSSQKGEFSFHIDDPVLDNELIVLSSILFISDLHDKPESITRFNFLKKKVKSKMIREWIIYRLNVLEGKKRYTIRNVELFENFEKLCSDFLQRFDND